MEFFLFIGGKGMKWSESFFWNFLKSLYSKIAYDTKQNDSKFFVYLFFQSGGIY